MSPNSIAIKGLGSYFKAMVATNVIIKKVGRSGRFGRIYLPSELSGSKVAVLKLEEYRSMVRELGKLRIIKGISRDILNGLSENRKMFSAVSRTWNPVAECIHQCRLQAR